MQGGLQGFAGMMPGRAHRGRGRHAAGGAGGLRQRGTQPLRRRPGAGPDHGEFLAAEAADHAVPVEQGQHPADAGTQGCVAAAMAVTIVQLLEVVEVEHRDLMAVGAGQQGRGAFEEGAPVQRAGQVVAVGLAPPGGMRARIHDHHRGDHRDHRDQRDRQRDHALALGAQRRFRVDHEVGQIGRREQRIEAEHGAHQQHRAALLAAMPAQRHDDAHAHRDQHRDQDQAVAERFSGRTGRHQELQQHDQRGDRGQRAPARGQAEQAQHRAGQGQHAEREQAVADRGRRQVRQQIAERQEQQGQPAQGQSGRIFEQAALEQAGRRQRRQRRAIGQQDQRAGKPEQVRSVHRGMVHVARAALTPARTH